MPLSSKRPARVLVLGQSEPSFAGIGALNRQNGCSWNPQEKRHDGPRTEGYPDKGCKVWWCARAPDQRWTIFALYLSSTGWLYMSFLISSGFFAY